jgi:beta-phosphoglucomutase-like phosphatase (HAD superfamily)
VFFTDTERLYTEATQNICDEFGKKYTWEIKQQIMGKKEAVSAKMIVGRFLFLANIKIHHFTFSLKRL